MVEPGPKIHEMDVRWRRRFLIAPLFVLIGIPALWVGVPDVFHPLSLAAQLVALTYVLSGATALLCAGVLSRRQPHTWATAAILGGIAGAYVTGSMAAYANAYRPLRFWIFVVLAVLCITATFVGLVRTGFARLGVSAPLARAGASVAVIIGALQLWYTSIYLPNNTDVGIGISVSLGQPHRVSRSLTLVPLQLTMRNESSLTAVITSSMYAVTGVAYPHPPHPGPLSDAETLRRAENIGRQPAQTPEGNNVRYRGTSVRDLLAIGRMLSDTSHIFPSQSDVRSIVVAVPTQFQQFDVKVDVDYARPSRLTPAGFLARVTIPGSSSPPNRATGVGAKRVCLPDVRTYWALRETKLHRLTRRSQILVTNWCTQSGNTEVYANVVNDHGPTSQSEIRRYDRDYGLSTASFIESFSVR